MWEYEHSTTARVTPEAVWAIWSDVDSAASWNEGIESIDMLGPFASGTEFSMKPPGREPVAMRLADVVESERFVEVIEADGLVIRIVHQLEPLDDNHTRVTYRAEITGEAADQAGPLIGPGITAGFPETVAKLVELARR